MKLSPQKYTFSETYNRLCKHRKKRIALPWKRASLVLSKKMVDKITKNIKILGLTQFLGAFILLTYRDN